MTTTILRRRAMALVGLVSLVFIVSLACGGGDDEEVVDVGPSLQALPTPTADASLGVREAIKARQLAEEGGLKSTPTPAALASKEVSELQDTRGFDRFSVRQITPTPEGLPSVVESGTMLLTGEGPSRTNLIIMSDGLLMVEATHSGSREFVVTIFNEDHAKGAAASGVGVHTGAGSAKGRDVTISARGAYDGSRLIRINAGGLFGLDPGLYFVDVIADGAWTVKLSQPRWEEGVGEPLPISTSGSGDMVIGPIQLIAGSLPLKVTHDGSEIFLIELLKGYTADETVIPEMEPPFPVVNLVGQVDEAKSVTVNPAAMANFAGFRGIFEGEYAIVIQADGAWTLSLGE